MVSLDVEDWILVLPCDVGHVSHSFFTGKLIDLHQKIVAESKPDEMEIYGATLSTQKEILNRSWPNEAS